MIAALMLAAPGLWLCVAAYDNWRAPALNRDLLRQVVRLELMERDYPDAFALVAHRRLDNPRLIAALFALIRWAETLCAALMLIAAGMLALDPDALWLAQIAAAGFALLWAGFIIGGSWFCYWYCHPFAQINHFLLMLWGLLVLGLLSL
ncbi:MAG: DUF2165 family protein [Pseudooceanicola sp.]|nr:DUF2165 family protein [Pseudooceanicola sp.]